MNTDAEFLHELRNLSRALTLIHKDLQKLNARFFITQPIAEAEEEKDKSDQAVDDPITT